MLSIGLTGGIAAGKSAVSAELAALGAVVVDADVLAREVVEPGTPGLEAVVAEWGSGVLADDGSLDRAALGSIVFADPDARRRLGKITHPRVLAEHVRREREAAAADPGAIVVHDVPLIVEADAAPRYHLVLVVDAPEEVRIARMVRDRGMSEQDARARIAAQATHRERRAVADLWLDNTGTPDELRDAVRAVWHGRIVPYADNVLGRRTARRPGPAVLVDAGAPAADGRTTGERWTDEGRRLVSRLAAVLDAAGIPSDVSHIGSTAVPGLAAKDVIDLQVGVDDLDDPRLPGALAAAGFPTVTSDAWDHPHPAGGAPWPKLVHGAADPGRPVNLHVRATGSDGWRWALALRDLLRDDETARADYARLKASTAAQHAGDATTAGYADGKEPWFAGRGAALVHDRLAAHEVAPDRNVREPTVP